MMVVQRSEAFRNLVFLEHRKRAERMALQVVNMNHIARENIQKRRQRSGIISICKWFQFVIWQRHTQARWL